MTDFDTRIRQSLSEDDEAFLKSLDEEQGLLRQYFGTFQGPYKYWMVVVGLFTLIATGLGFYCIYQLFQAESTRDLILWAAGGWAAWTVQIQLKVWTHNRMNMLNIIREIKRLELQVVRLSEKQSDAS